MDASWYFSSEWGRDQRLRRELEAQAAHSANTSARLRSQLTRMQGSMERRISALATAFDAYVELGDVREQLSNLPSSAPVRRRARDAMATLRAGHNPTPLPEGQAGHWLGGAMNRVIDAVRRDVALPVPDLVAAPDGEAAGEFIETGYDGFDSGDRVLTGSRDARIFEALALGLLGYGDRAAASLPALLTTDGGFTVEQVLLFLAVTDGKFGDDVLASLREVMQGNLARSNTDEWTDWLSGRSRGGRAGTLQWVALQTMPLSELPTVDEGAQPIDGVLGYAPGAGTDSSTTDPGPDVEQLLAELVTEMINEGSPLERDLIHRAAVLRAQVEDPDAAAPTPRWDHDPVPVDQVVREAFEATVAGTPERRELFAWILPHVRQPIDEAMEPEPPRPVVVKARTPGGSIEVREDGPDDRDLKRARATVAERHARPPLNKVLLVVAGVVGVVAVLGLIGVGPQWWTIAGLVLAAALVGIAVWQVRPGGRRELEAAETREIEQGVSSARARVDSAVAEREDARRDHLQLAEKVREQLAEFDQSAAPAGSGTERD